MKTIKILNYIFVAALGLFAVMFGIDRFGNKHSQQLSDTTIYTEQYCQGDEFKGFQDVIPMEINIVGGKIESINILENHETPGFMRRISEAFLVERFYGLTPREAVELEIDAVSGATYSSKAMIKSVKTSMESYDKVLNPSPWTWQLLGIICCAVVLCILSICKKKLN